MGQDWLGVALPLLGRREKEKEEVGETFSLSYLWDEKAESVRNSLWF